MVQGEAILLGTYTVNTNLYQNSANLGSTVAVWGGAAILIGSGAVPTSGAQGTYSWGSNFLVGAGNCSSNTFCLEVGLGIYSCLHGYAHDLISIFLYSCVYIYMLSGLAVIVGYSYSTTTLVLFRAGGGTFAVTVGAFINIGYAQSRQWGWSSSYRAGQSFTIVSFKEFLSYARYTA